MTVDELLDFKKTSPLHLELSEEERDAMLTMIETCRQETDLTHIHAKLEMLDHHTRALFSRAQKK